MSPEENTQDTSGGTGPTDAPSQAAAAAPTEASPPQVQADQVETATSETQSVTEAQQAESGDLPSDGDQVVGGVEEAPSNES